jgi:hypothetical protein
MHSHFQTTSNRYRDSDYLQHNGEHTNQQHRGGSSNGMLADLRALNSLYNAANDSSAGESRRHRLCNFGVRYWQYQSFLHSQPIRIREWYIFSRYDKFTGKFTLRTLMMNPKAAGTTPTMERKRTCCQPTKYEIAAFLRHRAMWVR